MNCFCIVFSFITFNTSSFKISEYEVKCECNKWLWHYEMYGFCLIVWNVSLEFKVPNALRNTKIFSSSLRNGKDLKRIEKKIDRLEETLGLRVLHHESAKSGAQTRIMKTPLFQLTLYPLCTAAAYTYRASLVEGKWILFTWQIA